jgi:hypothetical protein
MRRLRTKIGALGLSAALIAPLPASAQRSAYGIDWSCGYEHGSAFVERLKRAGAEDISCLAGAGFWREALPRIGGQMDEDRQRLRNLLDLLLNGDETAFAAIQADYEAGIDEAILWLLIARGEEGLALSDRRTRLLATNLFVAMPPWVHEQYAVRLAEALMAEGDNRAALTLAATLELAAEDKRQKANAFMIRARIIENIGTTDEAVALYDQVVETGGPRLSAEAELRKIALMWRTGHLKTEEAVVVLRELVTIWRGEKLGAGITLALARAYYFDQQLSQALRLLVSLAGSSAPEEITREAERRIAAIADDLFVRRMDPATIGDLMDVYEMVRPFVAEEDAFWMGDLKLAEDLVQAGLEARAETIMRRAEPEAVSEQGGLDALMSAAELMVAFGDRPRARAFLDAIPRTGLKDENFARFEEMQARSLEVEDLKPLLDAGARQDVIAIIAERAWAEEAYGLYAQARQLGAPVKSWREPAAEYLARGERIDPATLRADDPRLVALSPDPKPSVYDANDLRPLLRPSAEVAGLAVNLTQIGQELSGTTPEATSATPRDQDNNET